MENCGSPVDGEIVELDHRSCASLDVSLFWRRGTNALFVQVIDWSEDDDFTVPVAPESALQAFHHPFAYAAAAPDESWLREASPSRPGTR